MSDMDPNTEASFHLLHVRGVVRSRKMKRVASSMHPSASNCLLSRLDEIELELQTLRQRKAALESYYSSTKGISMKRSDRLNRVEALIAELDAERIHHLPQAEAPADNKKGKGGAGSGKTLRKQAQMGGVFQAFDIESFTADVVGTLKAYTDAVVTDAITSWTNIPVVAEHWASSTVSPYRCLLPQCDLEFFTWMITNLQDSHLMNSCLESASFPLDFVAPLLANVSAEMLGGITLSIFSNVFQRAVNHAHMPAADGICSAVRDSIIAEFLTEDDLDQDKSTNQQLFFNVIKLGWTDLVERLLLLSESAASSKGDLLVPASIHAILRLAVDENISIFSPPSLLPSYSGFSSVYLSPHSIRVSPEPDNTPLNLTHLNVRCDTPFFSGSSSTFSLEVPVKIIVEDFAFFRVGFCSKSFAPLGECSSEGQMLGTGESIAFSVIPHIEASVLSSQFNAPSSALRAASASGAIRSQSHDRRKNLHTADSSHFRQRSVSFWSPTDTESSSSSHGRKFVVLKHCNGVTQHISDPPLLLQLPAEENAKLKFRVTFHAENEGSFSLRVGEHLFSSVLDDGSVRRSRGDASSPVAESRPDSVFSRMWFPAASLPLPDTGPYVADFDFEVETAPQAPSLPRGRVRKACYLLRSVVATVLSRAESSPKLQTNARRILNKKDAVGHNVLFPVPFDVDRVIDDHSVEFLTRPQISERLPPEILTTMFPLHKKESGVDPHYFLRRLPICVGPSLVATIHLRLYDEALFLARISPLVSVEIPDEFGNTPLILAVLHGQYELARFLVFERSASLAPTNSFAMNALQIALQNGQTDIVRMFLEHPSAVSIDVVNAVSPGGSNSVATCVKLHLFEFLRPLLERGGNPALPDAQSVTPVLYCLRHRRVEEAKILLSFCKHSHISDLNVKEKAFPRGTCGLYAAALGDLEVCKLLEALDVSFSATFDNNFNVLHAAVISSIPLPCFALLLALSMRRKVSVNAAEKRNYKTPLHYAVEIGRIDMAAELIKAGADVNVETKVGLSPMSLCTLFNKENVGLEFFYVARRSGLRLDGGDNQGWTALHYAAQRGYSNLIATLIELGKADVNATTTNGEVPIMTAVIHGHVDAAESILNIANKRIELHSLRSNICKLVHMAYDVGLYRFCRALLAAGAESTSELTAAIRKQPQRDILDQALVRPMGPLPDDSHHLTFFKPTCTVCASGGFFDLATKKVSFSEIARQKLIASFFGEEGCPVADVYFELSFRLVKHFGSLHTAIYRLQNSSLSPSTSPRSSPKTRALEHNQPAADFRLDGSESPRVDFVTSLVDIFGQLIPSVVDLPSLRAPAEMVFSLLQAAFMRSEDTRNDNLTVVGWEAYHSFPSAMLFHLIRSGCSDPATFEDLIIKANTPALLVNAVSKSKKESYSLLETAAESGNAAAVRVLLKHGAVILTDNDRSSLCQSSSFDADNEAPPPPAVRIPRSLMCAIRSGSKCVAEAFIEHMCSHPKDAVDVMTTADFPHFLTIALASNVFAACTESLKKLVLRHRHFLTLVDPFIMVPPLVVAVVWARKSFLLSILSFVDGHEPNRNTIYGEMPDLAPLDAVFHELNRSVELLCKIPPSSAKSLVNVGIFRCPAVVSELLRKGFPSSHGRISPSATPKSLSPAPAKPLKAPAPPQFSFGSLLAKPSNPRKPRNPRRTKGEETPSPEDTDIPLHITLKCLRVANKACMASRSVLLQELPSFDPGHIADVDRQRNLSSAKLSDLRADLEELVIYLCHNRTVPTQYKLRNAAGQSILHLASMTGSPRAIQACIQHVTEELTSFHAELLEVNSLKGLPTPSVAQLRSLEMLDKDSASSSAVDYFVRAGYFHGDALLSIVESLVSAKEKYAIFERIFSVLHPSLLSEMFFAHNAHSVMSCSLEPSVPAVVTLGSPPPSSIRQETCMWLGLVHQCVVGREVLRSNVAKKIGSIPSKTNFLLLCPPFLVTLVLSASYFSTPVNIDPSLNPTTRLTKNSLRNSISLKSAFLSMGIALSDQESEVKLAQTTTDRYAFNLFVPIPSPTDHAVLVETTSYIWVQKGRILAGATPVVVPTNLSIDSLSFLFLQVLSSMGQLLDRNPRQEALRANSNRPPGDLQKLASHASAVMIQKRQAEDQYLSWVQEITGVASRSGMVLALACIRHTLLTVSGSEPEKRIVPGVILLPRHVMTAALFKRHEVLRYLLSAGVSPALQDEATSSALVDMAISNVSEDSTPMLQEACRACLIVLLNHRALLTPAAIAFFRENPRIYDVNSVTSNFRDTLLHLAAIHSSLLVVEALLNTPKFNAANAPNKFDHIAYDYITEKRLIEPVGRLMLHSAMSARATRLRSGSDDVGLERRLTFSDTDLGYPLVQFRVALASKTTFMNRKGTRPAGSPVDAIPFYCLSPILRGPFLSEGETADGRFTTSHSEMAVVKISMPFAFMVHHLINFSDAALLSQASPLGSLSSQQPQQPQQVPTSSSPQQAGQGEVLETEKNPYQALRLSQSQILQLQQCKQLRNSSTALKPVPGGVAAVPPDLSVEVLQLTDVQKELIVSAVVQQMLGDAVFVSSADLILDSDVVQARERELMSLRERGSSIYGGAGGDDFSFSASGAGSIAPSKPSAVVCLIPMYCMKKLL
jgi:ankyrin repeat protein